MPAVVVAGVRYLTVREAADLLEVDPNHVRYLARAGRLDASRSTGPVLVTEASVIGYRESRGYWAPAGVRGGRAAAERVGAHLGVVVRKGGRDAA